MLRIFPSLFILLVAGPAASSPVSFKKQVAPIFAASCNACHGANQPQSGFSMHNFGALMKGGRRGKALTPGKPADSLLYQYVTGAKMPKMPIGGSLKPSEIALIKQWIVEGAKNDGDASATTTVAIPKIPLKVKVLPQVASLAWSKDGRWLAVGLYKEVKLYDAAGKVERTLSGHAEVIRALAFSADGATLAAGGGLPGVGGEIKLWNPATGALVKTMTGHADCVYGLAWRPDGKQIATASYDKTVRLWDVEKGQSTAELKEHAEAVYAAAYSTSGKYLATAGADKSIRVWDANTGKRLYTLAGHTDAVNALSFHPTADLLVSCAMDKTARVWNLRADGGDASRTLGPVSDGLTDVRVSQDGSLVAASCVDGRLYVWKLDGGGLEKEIKAVEDTALSVAHKPDKTAIAVGGYDGSLRLFSVPEGKLSATLIEPPRPPVVAASTSGSQK